MTESNIHNIKVAKLMSVSPARAKVITSSLASAVATSSSSAFIVHQQQSNFSPMKEKELGQSLPPHSKKVHTPPVTQQDVQITLVSPKEPKTKTQSVGASGMSMIFLYFHVSPSLPFYGLVSELSVGIHVHVP